MWHSYTYQRGACAEDCCRQEGSHVNNYWACPACVLSDKAVQLEKLLRHYDIVGHNNRSTSLGPHALKYRKEYVQMGGVIAPFRGRAVPLCSRGCCWNFVPP